MKKLIVMLLFLSLMIASGCANTKDKPAPPKPPEQADTAHLTAEDKGLAISVSREIRSLAALNTYAKEGYEIVSTSVAIENNTKDNVPISPDFVTLKTTDGTEYKYIESLTDKITSKAAFKAVTLPPQYRGGGLLIFEVKQGSDAETITYKDTIGHDMNVKFKTDAKTNT